MKTYPQGVIQNYNISGGPPQWGPVDRDMWRYFGTESDAATGVGMIEGVMDEVQTYPAEVLGGIWSAFRYLPTAQVHAYLSIGKLRDADGVLYVLEGPTDIYDRDDAPKSMVDQYQAGEAHQLEVQRIDPTWGQLYWAAA